MKAGHRRFGAVIHVTEDTAESPTVIADGWVRFNEEPEEKGVVIGGSNEKTQIAKKAPTERQLKARAAFAEKQKAKKEAKLKKSV